MCIRDSHLELLPDRSALEANGADLAHVEIRVVDAAGHRVFTADRVIELDITGAGQLVALDSADPRDITPVQAPRRNAYEGRGLAIVRAGVVPGQLVVRASSPGLKPTEAVIRVP